MRTSDAQVNELIPGIPNNITVCDVLTKLPRVDVDNLASVSRGSCHRTIQSREVHDARLRYSEFMEGFKVVNKSKEEHVQELTLYNELVAHSIMTGMRGEYCPNNCLALPPLRNDDYPRDVPPQKCVTKHKWGYFSPYQHGSVKCATMDDKVYVLWGLDGKVHVLDVAGHRQWKQCADMLKPRRDFGCGAIAGKLYVHGGGVNRLSLLEARLCRAQKTGGLSIRTIAPLKSSRHAGRKRKEVFWDVEEDWPLIPSDVEDADPLEVYDPIKDEWRAVEPVGTPNKRMFVTRDKFYSMSLQGIHIYDFHANSWGEVHSFSFAALASVDPVQILPVALYSPSDLVALVDWANAVTNRSCLVCSRGLVAQSKVIVWEKLEYSDEDRGHDFTAHDLEVEI